MSLWKLALRSLQQRSLASMLTMFSLALGVGLVAAVLSLYGVISEAFKRNSSFGYNLIVGAKGSPLQLTLNTVFYLSQPVENLPYSYFLEFASAAERQAELAKYGGRLAEPERDGVYALYAKGGMAIPVCLGDYLGDFRVVATTPAFFDQLRYGENVDRPFEFADGRNFQENSPEHGYFEAVIGARVARERQLKVGDQIYPTHGDPDGHTHEQGFTIVGVLASTGTPNDRGVFINMEGFYLLDGHAKPVDDPPSGPDEVDGTERSQGPKKYRPLPLEQREITAMLLRPANPLFSMKLQNVINEGTQAQAAAPVGEVSKLMQWIVAPVQQALLAITLITCIVAAVGILVSIYNSMNERRRDIAVMRALGAKRETVMAVILLESLLIAVIGGVLGWLAAHAALALGSPLIEDRTGIVVGFFTTSRAEWMVLPLVIALAALAGLLPAWVAYRTDVARNL
jgi:putative ABC transport system permease protein